MSVNIFGSSGGSRLSSNVDKKYVDQKFATLSINLATKVNKSDDAMSGNLEMGGNKISNVGDPEEEKDAVNKIYVDKLTSSVDTLTYIDNKGESVRAYTDSRETATRVYIDEREKIMKTYTDNKVTATRNYIDRKHVKNNVGFIPDLNHNGKNKCGFTVSATGSIPPVTTGGVTTAHPPYMVFNSWKKDWVVEHFPVLLERWIKIKCPEPVKIHKFTIRGRDGDSIGKITEWKFQGSNDDSKWDDLYIANKLEQEIDYEFKTFQIPPTADRYLYYRFIILRIVGENIGLSHLQIYSVDPIM